MKLDFKTLDANEAVANVAYRLNVAQVHELVKQLAACEQPVTHV